MKKLIILSFLFINATLFSQDFYSDFLSIYNSYANLNSTYYYTQILCQYDADENLITKTPAKSIVVNNYEVTKIEEKNSALYFLSTPAGYWIMNKKLKHPLKISGTYKVMDIQMQDLLKLDLENDFAIKEKAENEVLLKRTNKKTTYAFIKIKKDKENFEAEIYDSKMQKIKTIVYENSILNGKKAFTKIQIYDDFLEKGIHYDYETLNQKEVKISKTLFNPSYMTELIRLIDSL